MTGTRLAGGGLRVVTGSSRRRPPAPRMTDRTSTADDGRTSGSGVARAAAAWAAPGWALGVTNVDEGLGVVVIPSLSVLRELGGLLCAGSEDSTVYDLHSAWSRETIVDIIQAA